jgi:hypothetical protein
MKVYIYSKGLLMRAKHIFLAMLICILAVGITVIGCSNDTTGYGGGSVDYTVTINNIHSSYNGLSTYNSFWLIDDPHYGFIHEVISANNKRYTVQNGSITGTFRYDNYGMKDWTCIGVKIGIGDYPSFASTTTYPVSQKRIVVDAKDMMGPGVKLSDPYPYPR